MAKFECKVCGYIYNEQQAGRPFDELTECPICNEDKSNFKMLEEEEVFFEWADEDDDSIIDVEVRPIDEDDEPSVDEPASPVEAVAEAIKQEEPAPAEEAVEETVVETAEVVEEAVVETAEVVEEAVAETAEAVEESVVETVEAAEETVVETEEGTSVNPAAALMKDLETAKDINTEYVVERRQEFWSPFSGTKTEKTDKEENPVKKAWSIENAYASVERVLDLNGNEVKPEVKEPVEEQPTDNEVKKVDAQQEAFEENAEELKILTTTEGYLDDDMEETAFKPLWQGGTDELPRVEEPLEAKAENVFKVEETAEAVAEETAEETVAEAVAEETVEETVAEAVAEETAEEAVEEAVAEETAEEAVEEAVAEETAEEAVEEAVAEETVEETIEEAEAEETAEETVEEATEEIAEETVEEAAEEVAEEEAVEVVPVFVAPPEAVEKLNLNDEFFEDIVTELPDDELIITPDGTEPLPIAEEVVEEVVEEPVEEVVEDKFSFGDLDDVEESNSNEVEEIYIQTEEDPDKKWTFNNSMSNTLKGQESNAKRYEFIAKELGENVVAEEIEEPEETVEEVVETEEVAETEEVIAVVPVEEIPVEEEPAVEEAAEEEAVEEPVAKVESVQVTCKKEVSGNGLDDIMILPAQLSPMPLDEKAVIETATVIGLGAERPLVLEQPVIKSNVKKVVEYAPNKGLTSEDFQAADVIEIIVGRGEGIEKTISSKEDLRQAVAFLRLESDGCPIGIKLAAGRIERDLEFCVFAKPDFVVLNKFNVVPLPYALYRAKKYLNTVQSNLDLVIELKDVADAEEAAKIIAMGADVIVLKDSDKDVDVVTEQLKQIAKETGNYEVSDLNVQDLCTTNRDIAQYTDIYHV